MGLTLCGMVEEPISPGGGFLFEMVQRNIAPDIAIEIDQDGVKARDTVKQFRNIIMRFNLGGVRVPLDAQW